MGGSNRLGRRQWDCMLSKIDRGFCKGSQPRIVKESSTYSVVRIPFRTQVTPEPGQSHRLGKLADPLRLQAAALTQNRSAGGRQKE